MQYFCWAPQIKVESQHFNHMMYWSDLRVTVVLKEAKLQKQKRSLSSSRTRNFPLQFTLHSPHFFNHSGTGKIIIINKKNNPTWILSKYWSAWQHQETGFFCLFYLQKTYLFCSVPLHICPWSAAPHLQWICSPPMVYVPQFENHQHLLPSGCLALAVSYLCVLFHTTIHSTWYCFWFNLL